MVDGVRHARAALVEEDDSAELPESPQEIGCLRLLPHHLDVAHPPRDDDEVDRTLTEYLICDVQVAALGVAGLRRFGHQPQSA